jgi:hypothetical protein
MQSLFLILFALLNCISGDVSVLTSDRNLSTNSSQLSNDVLLEHNGKQNNKFELLTKKSNKAKKQEKKSSKKQTGKKSDKDDDTKTKGKSSDKNTKNKSKGKAPKKKVVEKKKDTKKDTKPTAPEITETPVVEPTSTSTLDGTPTETPTATPVTTPNSCPLKSASNVVVFGSSTVTNVDATILNGDVVATTLTGFPPGIINGQQLVDAAASQATTDLTNAFTSLASPACTVDPADAELGGTTLTPGVYCFTASAQITGTLTLDAQGDANAQWIFRMPSTLTTFDGAAIVLAGGAKACNVFFVAGSSATIGKDNLLNGNILASASVSLTDGSAINGNIYANTGAITLIRNTITSPTESGS